MSDCELVGIKAGCFVSIGGRPYQEDRCVVISNLNEFMPDGGKSSANIRRSFYAVFDGHGGSLCSQYLADHFHVALAENSKLRYTPMQALQETWMQVESACLTEFQRQGSSKNAKFPRDGSTGTVCLVVDNDAYIANCGDSAAIVEYAQGQVQVVTEDHGTLNSSEVKRATAAGGHLQAQTAPTLCGCIPGCAKRKEVGKPRLYPGGLLVTRSFGDFYAKLPLYGGIPGVVTCEPGTVQYIQLNKPNSNLKDTADTSAVVSGQHGSQVAPTLPNMVKSIVLASDGVWDVLKPVEVCKHIVDSIGDSRYSGFSNSAAAGSEGSNVPTPNIVLGRNRTDEDADTKNLARCVCRQAVTSDQWNRIGCQPDNTSCILLQISAAMTGRYSQ